MYTHTWNESTKIDQTKMIFVQYIKNNPNHANNINKYME